MRWFAACFLSFAILADDVALIRVGEDWKFYKGASEPPAAWFKPDFDDSAWPLAMSGFSSGFGSDVTYFPDMVGNYLSVYFRKSFTVTDPKQVKWLTLRLDYSDGFVAYLNGQEIARRNLAGAAGSPVPYNAGATNAHRRAEIEEINVSAFAHLLVPGTNVLAMQVHNQERFDFEFLLVPELLANFTRGPFIQNASTNSVQVIWKTFFASDTSVEYGTNASLGMTLSLPVTNNIHAVTLTNLLPGTTYYYRAKSTGWRSNGHLADRKLSDVEICGLAEFCCAGRQRCWLIPPISSGAGHAIRQARSGSPCRGYYLSELCDELCRYSLFERLWAAHAIDSVLFRHRQPRSLFRPAAFPRCFSFADQFSFSSGPSHRWD